MLPFLPLVYSAWTARELALDYWTLGFLLARVLLWGIWNASLTVLCAINRHHKLGFILLGEGIFTGAMSVFLVPMMGIRGAALSALVADIFVSGWIIPILALRETGGTFATFAVSSIKAMGAIAIPVLIGVTGWHFILSSYLRWSVVFPASVLLALGLIIHQLDSSERKALLHIYRHKRGLATRVCPQTRKSDG
jgi:hypothetical protein